MPAEDLISEAADLAEALVDAISAPDQDWASIERSARKLAELASGAAELRSHEPP
jgi:hypothetical protein